MKYKVGDKVKIKTWKEMEKEYGLSEQGSINHTIGYFFMRTGEDYLNKNFPDRVLTIKKVFINSYSMKNTYWAWIDDMIECLIEDYKEEIVIPITNRFEILDL